MDSLKHDHCYNDIDFGYTLLVDKHIDKYERMFDENEHKLNRYLDIVEEITISDSEDCVANKDNSDNSAEKSNEKIDKQQPINKSIADKSIYKTLYKKWTHYYRFESKPTHIYTCEWCTCRCETSDYNRLITHLSVEHIRTRIYRDYKRSFVSLNVYQYKCTRLRCDYDTQIMDNIVQHIRDHNRCGICDTGFVTEDELSAHQSVEHNFRAEISGDVNNHLKCSYGTCAKRFITQYELSLHEIFNHTCVFKLNDKKYLNGNGVCSLGFIKQYYQKRKVIDGSVPNKVEYRYLCLWSECCYETYNYNAIQKHIHNRHTCPLFTGVVACN